MLEPYTSFLSPNGYSSLALCWHSWTEWLTAKVHGGRLMAMQAQGMSHHSMKVHYPIRERKKEWQVPILFLSTKIGIQTSVSKWAIPCPSKYYILQGPVGFHGHEVKNALTQPIINTTTRHIHTHNSSFGFKTLRHFTASDLHTKPPKMTGDSSAGKTADCVLRHKIGLVHFGQHRLPTVTV